MIFNILINHAIILHKIVFIKTICSYLNGFSIWFLSTYLKLFKTCFDVLLNLKISVVGEEELNHSLLKFYLRKRVNRLTLNFSSFISFLMRTYDSSDDRLLRVWLLTSIHFLSDLYPIFFLFKEKLIIIIIWIFPKYFN